MQAGGGGATHVGEAGGDDLGGAGQLPAPHAGHLGGEALGLIGGDLQHAVLGGVGDGGQDDEVAEAAQQVLGEATRILPHLDDLVDGAEHTGTVAGGEGVHHLVEQRVGGVAEQRGGLLVADALLPRPTQELVEDGQRVTH